MGLQFVSVIWFDRRSPRETGTRKQNGDLAVDKVDNLVWLCAGFRATRWNFPFHSHFAYIYGDSSWSESIRVDPTRIERSESIRSDFCTYLLVTAATTVQGFWWAQGQAPFASLPKSRDGESINKLKKLLISSSLAKGLPLLRRADCMAESSTTHPRPTLQAVGVKVCLVGGSYHPSILGQLDASPTASPPGITGHVQTHTHSPCGHTVRGPGIIRALERYRQPPKNHCYVFLCHYQFQFDLLIWFLLIQYHPLSNNNVIPIPALERQRICTTRLPSTCFIC